MDAHYNESFIYALLQYVDKIICFVLNSYKMEINLAILDWNENINISKTSEREIPNKRDKIKIYNNSQKKKNI